MRKLSFCLILLLGVVGVRPVEGAYITLSQSGWTVSWSDLASSSVQATDNGSQLTQARLNLTLIFNDQSLSPAGFFNPVAITFQKNSAIAAPEIVVRTNVVNQSSHPFGELVWNLMGGPQTQFDVNAMNIGHPGGLDLSGFNASFSSNDQHMYLTDGQVLSGHTYVLSTDAGIAVANGAGDEAGSSVFTLKVRPSQVPEPGSVGVLLVGGLFLMTRIRPAVRQADGVHTSASV